MCPVNAWRVILEHIRNLLDLQTALNVQPEQAVPSQERIPTILACSVLTGKRPILGRQPVANALHWKHATLGSVPLGNTGMVIIAVHAPFANMRMLPTQSALPSLILNVLHALTTHAAVSRRQCLWQDLKQLQTSRSMALQHSNPALLALWAKGHPLQTW